MGPVKAGFYQAFAALFGASLKKEYHPEDDDKHALRTDLNVFAAEVEAEYAVVDPDLQFVLESEAARPKAIDKDTATRRITSSMPSFS